jgi:hypothetical protein
MNYVLYGLGAYLILGIVLTRFVFTGASAPRFRFSDFAIGAVIMPVVCVAMLLFILFEKLWARLLIALDFDPPENLRAGPGDLGDPGSPDSDSSETK